MKIKSVILLSGGLDSAANLALCRETDDPVLAVTIRYGQKAEAQEIRAAEKFCQYYGVAHQVVDLGWLGKISNSSLNQVSKNIPQLQMEQLDDLSITQQTVKSVWVPNRNGVFIHVAAAFAETLGAERVVVGFNREEAVTFPDNSLDYLNRVTSALELSTSTHVRVFSYTVQWNKREIVTALKKLPLRFPVEAVWSCYEGGDKACLQCESCQRLARATAPFTAPERDTSGRS